jgi:two-component system, NtrC family, nitrogen regulation sensor histidine kinase NtrY
MVFSFQTAIIARAFLLAATMFLAIWLYLYTDFIITTAVFFILIIFITMNLIRAVGKTNDQLTRFLDSIRYSDFSINFGDTGSGKSFEQLNRAFSDVIDEFRRERSERQESYRTLQTVIQHVGTGLLAFNQKGDVIILNTASKRMLDISGLHQVKDLQAVSSTLYDTLMKLQGGNRALVRLRQRDLSMQLSVYATEFVMKGDTIKLVSLQNISHELEEKEMEAWQNITQVLAHEIMNSITPISSLSDTVHSIVNNRVSPVNNGYMMDEETLQDVRDALKTISSRSQGLIRFVQSYRDFTQIPTPEPELIKIGELLGRINHLMKGEFERQGVEVKLHVEPESLKVEADPQLIEQILINLTKNALSALRHVESPRLEYRATIDNNGRIRIDLADNGPGIKKEALEKIFIPFYTSAGSDPVRGTGIGLSLSRQIMRLHHGTLTVTSEQGEGAVFSLRF